MGMMDIMYPGRDTELGEVDDILRPNADSNPLLARGVVTTSLDALINWARTGSMWRVRPVMTLTGSGLFFAQVRVSLM